MFGTGLVRLAKNFISQRNKSTAANDVGWNGSRFAIGIQDRELQNFNCKLCLSEILSASMVEGVAIIRMNIKRGLKRVSKNEGRNHFSDASETYNANGWTGIRSQRKRLQIAFRNQNKARLSGRFLEQCRIKDGTRFRLSDLFRSSFLIYLLCVVMKDGEWHNMSPHIWSLPPQS